MWDTQREYDTDKFMDYIFQAKPTFIENCLTCKHCELDTDVGDQLCGADNFKTCQSLEIEFSLENIECQMYKKERR